VVVRIERDGFLPIPPAKRTFFAFLTVKNMLQKVLPMPGQQPDARDGKKGACRFCPEMKSE